MKSARYEKLIEAFGGTGQYVTDTQSLAKAVSELSEVLDHRERKIIFKRFGGTVEVDFEPAEAEIRFHVFGLTIACRSPVIERRLFINSVNIVKDGRLSSRKWRAVRRTPSKVRLQAEHSTVGRKLGDDCQDLGTGELFLI
jgi:hypothetical protein